MNLSADILILGTGCTKVNAAIWAPYISAALAEFKIADAIECAAFLPNVGAESGGLTQLIESTNYSAQGLANTWPGRYAANPKAKGTKADPFVPNDVAARLNRNPQAIANITYANRMGNGDVKSGDGYRYRGRGLFQITGKAMYERCGKALGLNLVSNPDLLLEPHNAARSAAWYFVDKDCDKAAKDDNFSLVVKLINGQLPCAANHGPDRVSKFLAVKEALAA